ncbi:hypothetical protein P5673_015158 [Acropora cervicornis]|uniref:Uncharacterized protein n=1 Tax=Acropora cervicornis TaxID=6130 RepID=A0AAD9QI99_ACRCE|nr:hypothetical protein P5673_015158 [Acropora cervicornis]
MMAIPDASSPFWGHIVPCFRKFCIAAYGSVSHLSITNAEGKVHCAFVFAKLRVTPLKFISIPCLELSDATISIHLDKMLKREIEILLSEPPIFWTDSMSILRYIKNENKRFHIFLATRIAMIRDSSSPGQWYHLERITNPGDHTSRGLSAEGLLTCLWGRSFCGNWKANGQLNLGTLQLPSNMKILK